MTITLLSTIGEIAITCPAQLVKLLNTERKIKGSNPAVARYEEKIAEKK